MNHTMLHRAAPRARTSMKSADPIAGELRRYNEFLRDVRGFGEKSRQASRPSCMSQIPKSDAIGRQTR